MATRRVGTFRLNFDDLQATTSVELDRLKAHLNDVQTETDPESGEVVFAAESDLFREVRPDEDTPEYIVRHDNGVWSVREYGTSRVKTI